MPVDGTLIFDTKIDRSGIEKGSKLAKSDLEKLGTQVKDIFSSKNLTSGLADLGGKLVGAFAFAKLAQGLGQVATAAIKYNAQMEAYQTNFSVMGRGKGRGVCRAASGKSSQDTLWHGGSGQRRTDHAFLWHGR